MEQIIGLQVDPADSVATVFSNDTGAGTVVTVMDRSGGSRDLTARQAIPYGHKIALSDMAPGQAIVKYGQVIGQATESIAAGDYVHIHNLESRRGRGDWAKEAEK